MKNRLLLAALAVFVVAGCGEEFKPPEKDDKEAKAPKAAPAAPAPTPVATPEPKEEEAKVPAPDPTDPKEIAEARNVAILDGRIEDALRLCGKEDFSKVDEQGVLGCVLAACRNGDAAKAKAWAASLKGALLKEARKVCAANKVGPL